MTSSPLRDFTPFSDRSAGGPDSSAPSEPPIRILVVDDDRALREGCVTLLESEGYSVTTAGRGDEAIDLVKRTRFDIALVDLHLAPVSGLDVLRAALEANKEMIVIIMTGNPTVSSSVDALGLGAWDYLPKPFSASHVQILVGRAAHLVLVSRETKRARERLAEQSSNSDKVTLLGTSPALRRSVDLARRVALTDASVMILGESGTGKEVIAQFIHRHSRRASRPLVSVNCAALPDALLESELFGHMRGAFTGADRTKPGLLETANGGTFFLDEVTEMSLPLQAKLLRVLQDGIVRRVGSEAEHDAIVNVRFISATNREPEDAVNRGLLRKDLFYRLRVVPIRLPPLRERLADIPLLANHFLTLYWERHRGSRLKRPTLSEECLEYLASRRWRGNVRELQNVIEHAAVVSEPGQLIEASDILAHDEGAPEQRDAELSPRLNREPFHIAKDRVVAQFERDYLAQLVVRCSGNMSKAARLAGIDRTTLYRLLEKHGLPTDERSHPSAARLAEERDTPSP